MRAKRLPEAMFDRRGKGPVCSGRFAKYFRERFIADGGEIVAEQKYSEGDKDFNAQLTAIKAAGADAKITL